MTGLDYLEVPVNYCGCVASKPYFSCVGTLCALANLSTPCAVAVLFC